MSYEHAKYLRENQTPAEQLLWAQLRKKRVGDARFRRQHAIGPFVVDFYCHAARLVIEIDGEDHDLKHADDERRARWLERYGLRVVRFSNREVQENLDGVVESIEVSTASRSPPLDPLPEGGEKDDV